MEAEPVGPLLGTSVLVVIVVVVVSVGKGVSALVVLVGESA